MMSSNLKNPLASNVLITKIQRFKGYNRNDYNPDWYFNGLMSGLAEILHFQASFNPFSFTFEVMSKNNTRTERI